MLGGVIVLFGVKVGKDEAASLASTNASFDFPGTIALTIFTGCLVVGLSMGTSFLPFGSMGSNGLFVVALVALVAFIMVCRKKGDSAIIPLSAFKDRNTLCFTIANFFSLLSQMALFFFLPLYILRVMGMTATESGIAMACISIVGLFLSPVFGKRIGKSGNARGTLVFVSVFRIIVGLGFIFLLKPDSPLALICVLMLIAGVYNCAGGSVFSAGPQIQLRSEIRTQGNAVIQQMQTLGSSIGIAVYTVCIGIGGMEGGFTIALVISVISAGFAILAALGLRKLEQ